MITHIIDEVSFNLKEEFDLDLGIGHSNCLSQSMMIGYI